MAYSITSSDLADILGKECGKPYETSMSQAIENLYAADPSYEFARGVSRDELTTAMLWLLYNLELIGISDFEDGSSTLSRFLLSDIVPLMMKYGGLYVNDEGEYWV